MNRFAFPYPILKVAEAVRNAGGQAYCVGGCVRDLLLGIAPKDWDLEIYRLLPQQLEQVLKGLGPVKEVGKRFGVFKLRVDELEIDCALPRREKKIAAGYTGFAAEPDPFLSPEKASARRDFTINAMLLDPLTGTILDPHGGQRDLKQRILRHVSNAFVEDPLRPLRGMQFAARFALHVASETAQLARTMLAEYDTLPGARIWQEWRKWALAPHPSYGLDALQAMGWLAVYPEIEALIGCPQHPRWHPEGDVWRHTKLCCDQAAHIARRDALDEEKTLMLLFAALAHDFGKPACTQDIDGVIRSPGHEQKSAELSTSFLARIHAPKRLFAPVAHLVRDHLAHLHGKPTPRAVRRLAVRLAPATIEDWARLVEADASARPPHPPANPASAWLAEAERQRIAQQKPPPIVQGRMLLALGLAPGPQIGKWVRRAYQAQLDGVFADEKGALAWLEKKLHRSAKTD